MAKVKKMTVKSKKPKIDSDRSGEDVISLSDRDFDKVLQEIENPPRPNEKLKKAFKDHSSKIQYEKK